MASGTYGIVGIPPPPDVKVLTKNIPYVVGMPLRQEITAWIKDPDNLMQYTLFMYALAKFQAMPVGDKLSYFQVAGIHCYPLTAWDSAPAPEQPDQQSTPPPGEDSIGGYCIHNKITFPTWHRPYMLLFEQSIWTQMGAVIAEWKAEGLPDADVGIWQAAADSWRMPYWDWARKQSYTGNFGVPEICTLPTVQLTPPIGLPVTIPNPLYQYENPMKDAAGAPLPFGQMPAGLEKYNIPDDPIKHAKGGSASINPWSQCSATSRYGITYDATTDTYSGLTGVNDDVKVNDALANPWFFPQSGQEQMPSSCADAINRMFSPDYNSTWGTFASTKWVAEEAAAGTPPQTDYMSLEYIHNNIHNLTGGTVMAADPNNPPIPMGNGHMADPPVASFDPIFWLHHCQVDRLLSIWQAINWALWWDREEPIHSDFPDPTSDSFLQPFHTKSDGNPDVDTWTSDYCRNWTNFGYQYDDLMPPSSVLNPDGTLNEAEYVTHLRAYLEQIYPSTSNTVKTAKPLLGSSLPGTTDTEFKDYIINVVYDRYALQGRSYTIVFFFGPPPPDSELHPTMYLQHPRAVGSVYTFSGMYAEDPADQRCGNCADQQKAHVLSKAQVPITIPLLRKVLEPGRPLRGIGESDVTPWLKDNLHWRFVAADGEVLPADRFPDTNILVHHGRGTHPSDGRPMPTYTGYVPAYDATEGKAGGVGHDDPLLGDGARGS